MTTMILTIDATTADLINQIDRTRTDGGLGCVYTEGVGYQCADRRTDPAYADYAAIWQRVDFLRPWLHRRRVELRLAHQTGGFTHDGHRYASDLEQSIYLLTAAVIGAQVAIASGAEAVAAFDAALGAGWRSTDGVARITTAAGIVALHAAFVAHGAACDRRSQALKALIDAAETLEDLAAIEAEIETGWPE